MDIANFIIGQLVGLAEPLLVLGFIIKCLGWKEPIKHQKRIYIGASLFVFLVAQGNGRFPGSYVIIIAIDVGLLCIFSLLFLTKNSVMKIMICILAEVINLICPLIVMQVTSYIINTSIFDFLQNEGSIFAAGAIVSKYKGQERPARHGTFDCRRTSEKTGRHGGILRGRDVLCTCVSAGVEENSETIMTILILEKYLDIIY